MLVGQDNVAITHGENACDILVRLGPEAFKRADQVYPLLGDRSHPPPIAFFQISLANAPMIAPRTLNVKMIPLRKPLWVWIVSRILPTFSSSESRRSTTS